MYGHVLAGFIDTFAAMERFWKKVAANWKLAFDNKRFKMTLFGGLLLLIGLLAMLPIFYPYIEQRDGYVLNDWLLARLQPRDVSIPIFMIVWGAGLLGIYRTLLDPLIFVRFMYAYIVFLITRSTCLVLVPLDPPFGIVELKDPLTNIFYGGSFMTKDLFYSGHTSSVVMIALVLHKKIDKIALGVAAAVLGTLLLVQHVHYTIDVVAAVLFSYACYVISNFIVKKALSAT